MQRLCYCDAITELNWWVVGCINLICFKLWNTKTTTTNIIFKTIPFECIFMDKSTTRKEWSMQNQFWVVLIGVACHNISLKVAGFWMSMWLIVVTLALNSWALWVTECDCICQKKNCKTNHHLDYLHIQPLACNMLKPYNVLGRKF